MALEISKPEPKGAPEIREKPPVYSIEQPSAPNIGAELRNQFLKGIGGILDRKQASSFTDRMTSDTETGDKSEFAIRDPGKARIGAGKDTIESPPENSLSEEIKKAATTVADEFNRMRRKTPEVGKDDESRIIIDEPGITKPILSPELRKSLENIVTIRPEDLLKAPLKYLEDVYDNNRKIIDPIVDQIKSHIPRLGFSGRGAEDLEKIFKDQRGSYNDSFSGDKDGGSLMVWGIKKALDLTTKQLVPALEEACWNAHNYAMGFISSDKNHAPGGIMIVLPDGELDVRRKGSFQSLRPSPQIPNPIGEDTIPLVPDNFKQVVIGAIGADRFKDLSGAQTQIAKRLGELLDSATKEKPTEERRKEADEYNQLLPRKAIASILISSSILVDTLKLLDTSSER